ncbi:MAG TPA: hypothetical protein VF309_02520, partial [Usitatibacter sp.]
MFSSTWPARLPLSSGLLAGKLSRATAFAAADHRGFNRGGAQFDRGETFSGLDYRVGLEAVEALRPLVPAGQTLPQMAIRWILMNPAAQCWLAYRAQALRSYALATQRCAPSARAEGDSRAARGAC